LQAQSPDFKFPVLPGGKKKKKKKRKKEKIN
jgi:hypothetical protein